MLMHTNQFSYNYPSQTYRLYEVKRNNSGNWYIRFTRESLNKEMNGLREGNKSKYKAAHTSEEEMEKIYANKWSKLNLFPEVESSYQKWLRDGLKVSHSEHFKSLEKKEDE